MPGRGWRHSLGMGFARGAKRGCRRSRPDAACAWRSGPDRGCGAIGLDQPRAAWGGDRRSRGRCRARGVQPATVSSLDRRLGARRRVYAGAMLLVAALLRNDPQWGLTALLFLFATVWITDIFAYFGGRSIGGPLLWPRVSPKKTWSGAVGGLAGGVVAGLLLAYASGVGKLGIVGVMALFLSVSAQAGDLFEVRGQAAIRRQGRKPSHPGPRRFDGPPRRISGRRTGRADRSASLHAGADAPARGLLVW